MTPLSLWPRQALIGLVQGYRYLLKPWLGNACRFEPERAPGLFTRLGLGAPPATDDLSSNRTSS